MEYELALHFLSYLLGNNEELEIPTLGGHTEFYVSINNNTLILRYADINIEEIDIEMWNAVRNRRFLLYPNERNISGNYQMHNWPAGDGNPNGILSPYIAAIMKKLEEPENWNNN